jgi:hypothetical protein
MTTLKHALVLGLAAMVTPFAQATTVDFHFGGATQTGAAAVGGASDFWNANSNTNGGPVILKDVTGLATPISVSWTSGDAWAVTKTIYSNAGGTLMDATTKSLMSSYAASYSYAPGATNLTLSLTGLPASQAYTLVLYAAGDQKSEGTIFTVTGSSTYTGSTTGIDRKISDGPGVAYVVMPVVSSTSGTLKITTAKNASSYATLNGFQLVTVAAATTTTATPPTTTTAATSSNTGTTTGTAASTSTTGSTTASATTTTAATTPMVWGICGHPTWSDYASWIPANVTTQMSDINQLGATYYRVSFEGASGPSYLDTLVPKAQAAGITLLPDLPFSLVAAASAQTNYSTNYTTAYNWATYAISKGYKLPYWEVGNEVENWGLVSVEGDGSLPTQFPDEQAGGFVAIVNGFNGSYQGIQDAYTAGRKAGTTTITPKVLIGMCYRHWGLLAKIQAYNNGVLPCDMISWHWYGPNYGGFNTAITSGTTNDNNRTPAACLGDFKSKTNPTQPMDVWITETNRSQNVGAGVLENGSVSNNATPKTSQDWAAEATAVQQNIDSFKTVPSVKGIFVYELFDEPLADSSSTAYLADEGYFGLITGLNGTMKNAFYTYQTEIKGQ